MTDPHLTREWARRIDEWAIDRYRMTGLVLMENAGRGCADLVEELGIAGPVVICCGRGNNAGDGFVIARHLDARGYQVKILLWCEPERLRGDAAQNYQIARQAGLQLVEAEAGLENSWLDEQLSGADWIVDALLGTGAVGEPRPPLDNVITRLNRHHARKLAVDLPSGLDCDTGKPAPTTFRADHTATFVAPKVGFRNETALPFLGTVQTIDIGIPRKLRDEVLRQK